MSQAASTFAGETAAYPVLKLAVARITARDQIRKHFDEEKLAQLGQSIKTQGLVQPIVVRSKGNAFEIVAGERRWRAAKLAEVQDIPAIVRDDLNDADAAVLQALENLQREDLSLAETCGAVSALVESLGFEETCAKLSKSPAWVSKHANVLKLPTPIQQLISDGKLESVDMAHDLATIHELSEKTAANFIEGFTEPDEDNGPPTREHIREEIRYLKDQKEREATMRQAQASAEASTAKENARRSAEEKAARERDRKIAKVKDDRKNLRNTCLERLQVALGFDPKKGMVFGSGVSVDYGNDFPGTWNEKGPFPATADACDLKLFARGDVDLLRRVDAALPRHPKIKVLVPDLTLDQAARLEAALHDVKGINFSLDLKIKGKELRASAEKAERDAAAKSPEKQGDLDVAAFISESLDRSDKKAKTMAADVHTAYVGWCKKRKVQPLPLKGADNAWGNAIAAAGIEKKRFNAGFFYIGVALR